MRVRTAVRAGRPVQLKPGQRAVTQVKALNHHLRVAARRGFAVGPRGCHRATSATNLVRAISASPNVVSCHQEPKQRRARRALQLEVIVARGSCAAPSRHRLTAAAGLITETMYGGGGGAQEAVSTAPGSRVRRTMRTRRIHEARRFANRVKSRSYGIANTTRHPHLQQVAVCPVMPARTSGALHEAQVLARRNAAAADVVNPRAFRIHHTAHVS